MFKKKTRLLRLTCGFYRSQNHGFTIQQPGLGRRATAPCGPSSSSSPRVTGSVPRSKHLDQRVRCSDTHLNIWTRQSTRRNLRWNLVCVAQTLRQTEDPWLDKNTLLYSSVGRVPNAAVSQTQTLCLAR